MNRPARIPRQRLSLLVATMLCVLVSRSSEAQPPNQVAAPSKGSPSSLTAGTPAPSSRTSDPNEQEGSLPVVAFGESVSGEIVAGGDRQDYVFTASPGQWIYVDRLDGSSFGSMNWRLEDTYGRTLAFNFTSLNDLGPVALMGGEYKLSIFDESEGAGTYTFQLIDATPQTFGGVIDGPALVGDLSNPGGEQRFSFDATEGQLVFIDVVSSSAVSGLNIELSDSRGRIYLARSTSLIDAGPFQLAAGEHTLRVLSEGGQTGTYEIQLRTVDSSEEAISVGTVYSREIDPAGDIDEYVFDGVAGQRLALDRQAASPSGGLSWTIVDPLERIVLSQTSGLTELPPFNAIDGEYRLTVRRTTTGTSTYQFRIVEVTDGVGTTSIGGSIVGDIALPGQVDRYSFTATAGQRMYFDVQSASAAAAINWSLRDELGREIVGSTSSVVDFGPISLVGGDYELAISSEVGGLSTYDIALLEVLDATQSASIGDTVSGSVAVAGQRSSITFTSSAGQRVALDVISTTSVAGLNFLWTDSVGRELLRTTSLSDQPARALVGGPYTLAIVGEGAMTADFEVALVDEGVSTHTPSGSPQSLGDTVVGEISTSGEIDDYTFTVTAGQSVFLDLLQGAGTLRWTLLDPAGQPLFSSLTASSTTSQNRGPFVLAAGTYQLSLFDVGAGTPSYEFAIVETIDESLVASVGTPVVGDIAIPGQRDTYSLAVGSDDRIYLDLIQGSGSLRWSLFDPTGQPIFSALSASSSTSQDRGPWDLGAGTYSLEVYATGDNTPAYEFTFLSVLDAEFTTAIGSIESNALGTPGSRHRYTLSLAQEANVYLDLLTGSSTLRWELVDEAGNSVYGVQSASNPGSNDQGPFRLGAGDHVLELFAVNSGAPSYSFVVLESQSTTTSLSLDSPVFETFPGAGDERVFAIELVDPQSDVFFDLQTTSIGLRGTFYDEYGQTIFTRLFNSVTSGDSGPWSLPAGSYELRVESTGGATPDYGFEFVEVLNQELTLDREIEVAGEILSPGGTTRYTFDVDPAEFRVFDVLSLSGAYRWTLLDEQGVSAGLFGNVNITSINSDQGPLFLAPGTYTLMFDGDNSLVPSFSFRKRFGMIPTPAVSEPDWSLTRSLSFSKGQSARFVGADELIVGSRTAGVFRIVDGGLPELIQTSSPIAGVLVDELGEIFYSEEGAGVIRRVGVGSWVNGFGVGDADPTGLRQVPSDYAGPLPIAGMALVADPGFDGPDGIWIWSTMTSGGDSVLVDDTSALEAAVDLIILDDQLYVADQGPGDGASGVLWRVEPGGGLTDMGLTGLAPIGLAIDPLNGDLLILDRIGSRVVRWTPGIPGTTDVMTGLRIALTAGWAGLDVSTDARQLAITSEDNIWLFSRCDLGFGGVDCNGNGVADDCDLSLQTSQDCNGNGIPDECDIASGMSADLNLDGIPDECLPCALVDVVFVVDTSGSMAGEAAALCTLLPEVVQALSDGGINVSALSIGISDAPGGGFACLTGNVRDLLGGDTGAGCGSTIAGASEDWGRGTATVAEFYDWRPGAVRLVVPISDEGPYCGSGISVEDGLEILEAIEAANDNGVIVSPITGDGSSQAVLDFAAELAAGTGGIALSTEESADEIGESILQIVLGACPCGVSLSGLEPLDGASFPVGTQLTLTGRATAIDPSEPIVAVLIDGVPVESVDISGRFFHPVTVAAGAQPFLIEIIQACGTTELSLTLVGLEDGAIVTEQFEDVTLQVAPSYSGTTYNPLLTTLLVDGELCNVSPSAVYGPLLFVIQEFTEASVSLTNLDGYTAAGDPYVTFDVPGGSLAPGECSQNEPLAFATPEELAVDFEFRILGPRNDLPVFTSIPPVTVAVGSSLSYSVTAFDPEGEPLTFSLVQAPSGVAFDAATALATWSPALSDVGVYNVRVAVEDPRGGRAEQAFTLSVVEAVGNRPPVFSSAPITQVPVGATYSYQATATDLDGDPLVFTKLEGPADLTVSTDGLCEWLFATPGVYPITIRVEDGQGALAQQTFLLTAGAVSLNPSAPVLFGSPSADAVVDRLYLYQPLASDADGDLLSYDLPVAPLGMTTDPANGRITWVPTLAQEGLNAVTLLVSDGGGAEISQSWTIDVSATPINRAPVVETIPTLYVEIGGTYTYSVGAFDPDFDPFTFSLVAPPAGMTIDPTTGLLTWTPAALGSVLVAIQVTDDNGDSGNQVFDLDVVPPNNAPEFGSTPITTATVGAVYQYAMSATDADGHDLTFALDVAPDGMTLNSNTGVITWTPGLEQIGDQSVAARVSDPFGGEASQLFDVSVLADTTPPALSLVITANPTPPGEPVTLQVQASDDVQVVERTLSVAGAPVVLGGFYEYTFTPAAEGTITLIATATDASGNVATETQTLFVVDGELDPTEVTLISPSPDSIITAPTDIVVTIEDDDPADLVWTVAVRPDGSDDLTEIGNGVGEVDAAVVANFDPTVLPNGPYWIRVTGFKAGIQTGGVEFRVQVTGNLKLGHFAFTVTDLLIPVAGIPLTITRRYDSLDTSPGDFGPGWNLGLSGDVTDDSAEVYSSIGLVDLLDDEPFRQDARVYVTLTDGRRVGFTFKPTPTAVPFLFNVAFEADDGLDLELEAFTESGSGMVFGFSTAYYEFFIPYNPNRYTVTTEEGIKMTLHERDGLERVEDVFGNFIDVQDDGLVSSTGVSVAFERNQFGSITRIVPPPAEPGGRSMDLEYSYDPTTRNLVASRDMGDNETTYDYDQPSLPHHLTAVNDPLMRPLVRTVYDAEGRAIAQCNAEGNVDTLEGCFEFSVDPIARTQTIVDGNGNQVEFFFDERGNLVLESQLVDGEDPLFTSRFFDDEGRLLSETDPQMNIFAYTYDDDGNQVTATDPEGRTWTYEYDESGNRTLECDPGGNCTTVIYNDRNKPILRTDSLGNEEVYVWNDRGERLEIRDSSGNVWTFSYTSSGRLETATFPNGSQSSYEYDGLGRTTLFTDRRGRSSSYTYSAAGMVETETWIGSSPPEQFTYEYDAVGNLVRATSSVSDLSIDYWPTGQVKTTHSASVAGSTEAVVAYGYDNGGTELASGYDGNGNVTFVSDSFGGVSQYSYDFRNSVTSISQFAADPTFLVPGAIASSVVERTIDLEYGLGGLLRTVRRYNDLDRLQLGPQTSYVYDCDGCPTRVSSIDHRDPITDTSLHAMAFVRDARGDVLSATDAEGTHSYSYDGMRRLLAVDHPSGGPQEDEFYSYDGVGNRLQSQRSSAYQFDYQLDPGTGNALRNDDDFSYDYDASGNLALRTSLADGSYTEFAHDYRNRLVSVARFSSGGARVWSASYSYDAANRRIRSDENGVVRQYVYDRAHAMVVLDGGGNVFKRRLYGETLDQALGYSTPTDGYWYLTGPKRSVRDIVDEAGSIVRHYVYDSFGAVVDTTGTVDDDLRFQSREFSDLTGLGYFRARHYDPELGRFVEEDPLTPYRYDFGFNNPLTFVDPTGEVAAIQYACKLISSLATVATVLSITNPTAELWNVVVEAVCTLTGGPDVGQGAAKDFQAKINKAVIDMFLEQLAESLGIGCQWKASQLLLNPPTYVPPSGC